LQIVENQGVDVLRGFIIVCFVSVCKKPQSHHKATTKTTTKTQTVENQALERFFCGFVVCHKKAPFKPTPDPTDQSVSWHDFCRQKTQQFYIFVPHHNNHNKNHKTVENQGLGFLW
jgi:hypothetical protein